MAGTRSSLKMRYAMKEKRYSFLMVPSLTFGSHAILSEIWMPSSSAVFILFAALRYSTEKGQH
jgi:hypothetical protein